MAGRISELPVQTAAGMALTDTIETVDVSDPTDAVTGTNKQAPWGEVITFLNGNGVGGGGAVDTPVGFVNRYDPVDAFGPPSAEDIPVITSPDFQEYNVTTIAGGVLHDVTRVGAPGSDLDLSGFDEKFEYLGVPSTLSVPGMSIHPNYFVQMPFKPGGAAQFARWYWQVEWETDATDIEIRCKDAGTSNEYGLMINGRWYSETVIPSVHNTNNRYVVKLVFPHARMRRIRFCQAGDIGFGGIWTNASAIVRKPAYPKLRVSFIGDSIVNGSGIAPTGARGSLETVAPRIAHLLDIDDPVLLGIGGTGWVAGAAGTQFIDRVSAVSDADAIIFLGSSNDSGQSMPAVAAAVTAAVTAALEVTLQVFVIGPHLNNLNTLTQTIRQAAIDAGAIWMDYAILPPADRTLVAADSIHPTFAGHKALTRRLNELFSGDQYFTGAITETAANATFLRRDGDGMTGRLFLADDPISGLEAATMQYVDSVALPSDGADGKVLGWDFGPAWIDPPAPATPILTLTEGTPVPGGTAPGTLVVYIPA